METTGKELCYKVSEYQRYLWNYRKLVDKSVEASEKEGTKKFEAFHDFASEVFHRLYSEEPCRLDNPTAGSEPYQKMHDNMDKLPELQDLATRCRGDEEWAGISTGAILDTILNQVEHGDEKSEDPRGDLDAIKTLESLLETTENEEHRQAVSDAIEEITKQVDGKLAKNAQIAATMDESQFRTAVRNACSAAQKEIGDREQAYESFLAGTDQHGGKQARRTASKKIAAALKNNSRLARIAKLAGRLRRIAIEQQRQKPKRGTDEITGIELGDNLSKLVPVEALFTAEETEVIFAKKYLEKSLQQFELNRTPPKQQGPVVVLLDSSGSMTSNNADAWAAAVALAFLEISKKQGRAFALVHFGSAVLRVDDWPAKSHITLESLLDSVSFFASDGGTDFEEPIDKGIELIEKHGSFKEADIIMITDGQSSISEAWLKRFKGKREQLGFAVYSVVIGCGAVTDRMENTKFSDETVSLNEVLKNDKDIHKLFGKV